MALEWLKSILPGRKQQAQGGLVREDITPDFAVFMAAVDEHMPEIVKSMQKSLASAAPQTQPLPNFDFMGLWAGVREPQAASGMTFEMQRAMSHKCPPIAAIIATRCNQVAAFCQIPESETDVGFRIALRGCRATADKPGTQRDAPA
jgi:hypothetical protein